MSRYFAPPKPKEEPPRPSRQHHWRSKLGKKHDDSDPFSGADQIPFKRHERNNFMRKPQEKDPFHGPIKIPFYKLKKYERGDGIDMHGLRGSQINLKEVERTDQKIKESVRQAVRNEILLPESASFLEPDENEDTFRIKQHEIASAVDITSASKLFSLTLSEFGPYQMDYSKDGRHLLLGGNRGHVAALDWVTKQLLCEINVMESIHDLCWLHIPTMFATAQKNWVFVYDNKGVELHCVKKLSRVLKMEFLPYHFLLVTSSEKGFLAWLDISIGKLVKETFAKAGRLNVLCQNPYNAVVATGHPNGTVSMWSPNVDTPLVKMLCHPHAVKSIAIDSKGMYMATASMDRTIKVWDVRMLKCLQTYKVGGVAGFMHFSQKGLLAVGLGNVVEVYKDCCTQSVKAPYMRHRLNSTVADVQFCPYEDVMGIGHSRGFDSVLVPGSGEPNFDALEANPFMTKNQRREMEVRSLLEKIQPELITLDTQQLGRINVKTAKEKLEQQKALLYVKPPIVDFEPRQKNVRSKSAKVLKAKKGVVEQHKRGFIAEAIKEKTKNVSKNKTEDTVSGGDLLDRFRAKAK